MDVSPDNSNVNTLHSVLAFAELREVNAASTDRDLREVARDYAREFVRHTESEKTLTDEERRVLLQETARMAHSGLVERRQELIDAEEPEEPESRWRRFQRRKSSTEDSTDSIPQSRRSQRERFAEYHDLRTDERVTYESMLSKTLVLITLVVLVVPLAFLNEFTSIFDKTPIGRNASPPKIEVSSDDGLLQQVFLIRQGSDGSEREEQYPVKTSSITITKDDWKGAKRIYVRATATGKVRCKVTSWKGMKLTDSVDDREVRCFGQW